MLHPYLLPPKTAFLISPLDMGAISAFKTYFHKLERSTLRLKIDALNEAWSSVSNESLRNVCFNCGVIGDENIESIRSRFMKDVVGRLPEEMEEHQISMMLGFLGALKRLVLLAEEVCN